MKKNDCKLIVFIIFSLALSIIYLFVDYFNIPSQLGIHVSAFNFDAIGLWVNSIVVIALFAVTYYLIDSRNLKKQKNQENNAKRLCLSTYYDCKMFVESSFKNSQLISFMCTQQGSSFFNQIYNTPFQNEEAILTFISDGTIPQIELEHYLAIKRKYLYYIGFVILSPFSNDNSSLEKSRKELIELLQHEISYLEKSLGELENK